MRNRFIILVIGFLPLQLSAQEETIRQNGRDTVYGRMFNPETITSISGTITEVLKMRPGHQMHTGTHIRLKTEKENIEVHVGPDWYLEKNEIRPRENQKVAITGSRIEMDGRPIIIASEITQDGKKVRLRDNNGIPLWSRQDRRNGRMRGERRRN
jgi:hypothetical protein